MLFVNRHQHTYVNMSSEESQPSEEELDKELDEELNEMMEEPLDRVKLKVRAACHTHLSCLVHTVFLQK